MAMYHAKVKEPKAAKTKKHLSGLSIFEITFYTVCAVLGVWGIVYIILGMIADYASVDGLVHFTNVIKSNFGMNAFYWGIMILAIAAIAFAIAVLCVNRVVERESDKVSRREARLAHLKEIEEEEAREAALATAIDAEVTPIVEETELGPEDIPTEETKEG